MKKSSSLVTIRPRRSEHVLLCKKCLSRVENGGKLKRSLKSELKKRRSGKKTRRPRLVLTSCLGICPKRAVVMASASTLRRGEFLLLSDSRSVAGAADVLVSEQNDQPASDG
ncbi:(2Fe-2S) ferredoxin domain-containing protein [Bradyrhizobium sp.]|uniref:(2Fe-2S) ferredoxin domain-containing protein n=1 Tax=Bradyrhizobium sp. TaxID=376 RepID=UPI003C473F90